MGGAGCCEILGGVSRSRSAVHGRPLDCRSIGLFRFISRLPWPTIRRLPLWVERPLATSASQKIRASLASPPVIDARWPENG
jgi:hypothetical protein